MILSKIKKGLEYSSPFKLKNINLLFNKLGLNIHFIIEDMDLIHSIAQ